MYDLTIDAPLPQHWWEGQRRAVDPIDGLRVLSELKVPAFATVRSLAGYSKAQRDHPERNQPDAVRALLEVYWSPPMQVWDPMAGAGTTMQEAMRLGAVEAWGWDCCLEYRALWEPLAREHPEGVDLVVTSPPYPFTNHSTGDTEAQQRYAKRRGSKAGTKRPDHPDHIGNAKTLSEWFRRLVLFYQRVRQRMTSDGVMCVLIRDKTHRGSVLLVTKALHLVLLHAGWCVTGKHPRKLRPSSFWHGRDKLNREAGKPQEHQICTEWALVATPGG